MPSFDTPRPITATVELSVGDLRIVAAERTDTVVEVRPSDPGSDADVRVAEQTRVEYADGRLLVKTPKQRSLGLFGKYGSVDVTLDLPVDSQLRAEIAAGGMQAAGTLADCRVKCGAGDVRLDRVGPLARRCASASASVDSVAASSAQR